MPSMARTVRTIAVVAAALLAACIPQASALADDCAPVRQAMLASLKSPHTATITRIENGGNVTRQMIQTKDRRYVEIKGQWRAMPFAPEDQSEMEKNLDTAKLTCRRVGSEQVGGVATTVYAVHIVDEDMIGDEKIWLADRGLPLKVESAFEGTSYSTLLDFDHADPPPDAKP